MRFLPTFLLEHPQIQEFLSWFNWLRDGWHEAQGFVILGGFAITWWALRRERVRLSERIETLRQILTASIDQHEEEVLALPESVVPQARTTPNSASNAPVDDLASWRAIRALWQDVKDRLEILIEEISNNRVRRKYSKMPRRRYRDIVNALERDSELTPKVADCVLQMETIFNRSRFRPRRVEDADVTAMRTAYDLVSKFLPPSPSGDGAQALQPDGRSDERVPGSASAAA